MCRFAIGFTSPLPNETMKAWKEQTPIMKNAAVMKATREQLWRDLLAHPEYTAGQVAHISKLIDRLNKQIAKRSLTPEGIEKLLSEVKVYSRNYKRMAARKRKAKGLKMSARAIKFTVKQTKKSNEKTTKKARQKIGTQTNIFS